MPHRSICNIFLLRLAFICSFVVVGALDVLGDDLKSVLELNSRSIASLNSMHLKVEYKEDYPAADSSEAGPLQIHELWVSGILERELITTVRRVTPDGKVEELPGEYQAATRSFGERESRNLSGWTPESKDVLPLDPGRDQKAFARVRCTIAPRDPGKPTSPIWQWMLFHSAPGKTLEEIGRTSSLRLLESTASLARISVETSDSEHLVGATIELDLEHGGLIRRVLTKDGWDAVVDEFAAVEGQWLPKAVTRSFQKFRSRVSITPIEINRPYSSEFLTVNFPEGARVDEPSRQLIHIWGQGEPAQSFETFDQLAEYVNKRISEAPRPSSAPIVPRAPNWNKWLVGLNVGTIVAVVVLLFIRRWLAKS